MTKLMIDFEISLSQKDVNKLKELADLTERSVPEVAIDCMMEKCEELLDANRTIS